MRREMREIRDTKSSHFSVPTSEKGTGVRLSASLDHIYISWALILENLHVRISMPPPHGCAVPSLILLLSRVK